MLINTNIYCHILIKVHDGRHKILRVTQLQITKGPSNQLWELVVVQQDAMMMTKHVGIYPIITLVGKGGSLQGEKAMGLTSVSYWVQRGTSSLGS